MLNRLCNFKKIISFFHKYLHKSQKSNIFAQLFKSNIIMIRFITQK